MLFDCADWLLEALLCRSLVLTLSARTKDEIPLVPLRNAVASGTNTSEFWSKLRRRAAR
jgi:hypothetical protein